MNEVLVLFKKHFGHTPANVVRAPERLELLGNHTDYNGGLVMSVAVNKYIFIACTPRLDGKIELVSSAFPEREIFWMSDIRKNPSAPWADYVKGVLLQLRKHGVHFGGFSAAIYSTIPMGAGMSSSAALEVATALAVRKLYPFRLTENGTTIPPKRNEWGQLPALSQAERMHFAKLCHAAEKEFLGVQGGILDQISSLFGQAWHVMSIDCRDMTVERMPLAGEAVIVCDTKVRHALTDRGYKELRENCEGAAQKLGVKFLRSADMSRLLANRKRLTEREFECAHHVISEIARVVAGERVLRDGDYGQFGQFMFQSHQSSRHFFKNSCAELDTLVDIARLQPGCLGVRLTGGGFGGATVNLVAYHEAETFMKTLTARYLERKRAHIEPMICQMVDGAE